MLDSWQGRTRESSWNHDSISSRSYTRPVLLAGWRISLSQSVTVPKRRRRTDGSNCVGSANQRFQRQCVGMLLRTRLQANRESSSQSATDHSQILHIPKPPSLLNRFRLLGRRPGSGEFAGEALVLHPIDQSLEHTAGHRSEDAASTVCRTPFPRRHKIWAHWATRSPNRSMRAGGWCDGSRTSRR